MIVRRGRMSWVLMEIALREEEGRESVVVISYLKLALG